MCISARRSVSARPAAARARCERAAARARSADTALRPLHAAVDLLRAFIHLVRTAMCMGGGVRLCNMRNNTFLYTPPPCPSVPRTELIL